MVMILMVVGPDSMTLAQMVARSRMAATVPAGSVVIDHDPDEVVGDTSELVARVMPLEAISDMEFAELQRRLDNPLGPRPENVQVVLEPFQPCADLSEAIPGANFEILDVILSSRSRTLQIRNIVELNELPDLRLPRLSEPRKSFWETHRDHSTRPPRGSTQSRTPTGRQKAR